MERGLRQEDPLSPFLYLLVAEALSILVNRAVDAGFLEAAEIGANKVCVSHLQYANDTIFVCLGKDSNGWAMRRILKNFEMLSGLRVNFKKCNIMGISIEKNQLESMANNLGCSVGSIPFSFLGVKVGLLRNNSADWSGLTQKMKSKLKSWEDKKISL